MVEIEVDGRKVEVPEGSMVMHACEKLGTYVPHFCYHPKLSIAANCRMCLVDIEKAPKPMPACATPVTQGMVVRTKSDRAVNAQKGVMEFLLINHPLDCPICDQGGECQLQDLAVGYGAAGSRYAEEKRVVQHKDVGPLIGMEEMSRCIHCTRCVRFGQELAGIMELGMLHRGEHSEITTFVGMSVDSELSGNMIDLCPVGALTSKPFRYSARTWELSRRKSISPHDSTGANLVVQVKDHRVMRVLPLQNDDVNEYWISDRDRFSYEGLHAPDRLTEPLIRDGAAWRPASWDEALNLTASKLAELRRQHAGNPHWLATLLSPNATLEELYLATRLTRELGSDRVASQLRQAGAAKPRAGRAFGLKMPIAALSRLNRALVIGSFLRKDHPLFALRLRQAAQRGAQISLMHAAGDDPLMRVHAQLILGAEGLLQSLRQMVEWAEAAAANARDSATSTPAPASAEARRIVESLQGGAEHKAVLIGNWALQHQRSAEFLLLAGRLAKATGATLNVMGDAGNFVGGYIAGAYGQVAAQGMLEGANCASAAAVMTYGMEPAFDCARAGSVLSMLQAASFVVHMSPYAPSDDIRADVVLPIAPFTETAGSFVNAEGRLQSFNAVVRPLGQARAGWKVLRVLAQMLELPAFDHDTIESVRAACVKDRQVPTLLANDLEPPSSPSSLPSAHRPSAGTHAFEAVLQVPIYSADPIVRRAPALQATADGQSAQRVGLAVDAFQVLGLPAGPTVLRLRHGERLYEGPVVVDRALASGCIRIPYGPIAAALDLAQGDIVTVEHP